MSMQPSRLLRAVHQLGRRASSSGRRALLEAEFPGLQMEGRVFISPGCDIRVNPGGRLRVSDCIISRGVNITVGAGAVMEIDADFIGPNSVIVARERVTIGSGSKIAENVTVRDGNHDHSVELRKLVFTSRPVFIGEDVWLAAGSTVLQGVAIGRGATIGAGAVVTKDVPDRSVAVGVPARVLRAPLDG